MSRPSTPTVPAPSLARRRVVTTASVIVLAGTSLVLAGCSSELTQKISEGSEVDTKASFGVKDVDITLENKTDQPISVTQCADLWDNAACTDYTVDAHSFTTLADFEGDALINGVGVVFTAYNGAFGKPFFRVGAQGDFQKGVRDTSNPWANSELYWMDENSSQVVTYNGHNVELDRGSDTDDKNMAVKLLD